MELVEQEKYHADSFFSCVLLLFRMIGKRDLSYRMSRIIAAILKRGKTAISLRLIGLKLHYASEIDSQTSDHSHRMFLYSLSKWLRLISRKCHGAEIS